ncbi:MAG: LacI family DNA-binding transcriptional regulator [Peptoniphilus lacrimalis]
MTSTIKDVAKMADVSISTVSRVINDSKPVSPEARRRVLHAIDVSDYKPNEVARSLVTKKSNLIGVIVEDIGLNFISRILQGLEEVGKMYNYDILLSSSYKDLKTEVKFANLLLQKQVEGIIVVSNMQNPKLEYKLEEAKIPHVLINNFYQVEKFQASIDFEKASKNMVELLMKKGHKKIASLAVKKDIDRTLERFKVKGYEKAMEEHNLKKVQLFVDGWQSENIEKEKEKIIKTIKEENITAIFTTYDTLAINLINVLYDNGIKVPEDVSVTGFGGGYLSSIYRPRLTTVKMPYYDIGAISIRQILKTISNKEKEIKGEGVLLPIRILERESVKEIK